MFLITYFIRKIHRFSIYCALRAGKNDPIKQNRKESGASGVVKAGEVLQGLVQFHLDGFQNANGFR